MISIDVSTGLFLVFLISAILLYTLGRFNIPFIVSLIIAGIILNQIGVFRASETKVFEEISDFGIMLMLFFVGVEFSLRMLWNYKIDALKIGGGQIIFSFLPIFLLVMILFKDYKLAFIIATVITMSSTAVIVSIIEKKGEIGTRYGRISFLVSLVQDIVSIVILVVLPFLFGSYVGVSNFIFGVLVFVGYMFALFYFTKTRFAELLVVRDRYLIVFLAIVISFGSGIIAKFCGLSPFLGSFLAGIVISESFFGRQIASEVLPIKEIFVGFFFIYVGALINLNLLFSNLLMILGITVGVVVFKFIVVFILLNLNKESIEHNIRASVLISNMSEFSLLILSLGIVNNVINEELFVLFSSSVVLSMVLVSLIFKSLDKLEYRFSFLKVRKRISQALGEFDVIIVGFGPVGKKLVESLKDANISHIVLEMNSETVRKYKDQFNIHFGDAKRENILRWAGISSAKLLVITAPILNESLFISEKARALNPNISVIARVKFTSEVEILKNNGVYDVICDEISAGDSLIDLVSEKIGLKLIKYREVF